MSKKRWGQQPLTPAEVEQRKEQILTAALGMTRTHGYRGVTRDAVAQKAGVSAGMVNRYFGTMADLMEQVMREAVEQRLLPVVAQGLAHNNPVAMGAPAEVQAAAMASVGAAL